MSNFVEEEIGKIKRIRRKTFGERFNEAFEAFMGFIVVCLILWGLFVWLS